MNTLAFGNPRGYLPPNPKPVKNPWLPPELDPNFAKKEAAKKKKTQGKSIRKNKKKSDDGDGDSNAKVEAVPESAEEEEDIDPNDPFAAMKANLSPDPVKIDKNDEKVLDSDEKKEGSGTDHSDPDHEDKGIKAKNEHHESEGGSENDDS
jgi:hypothetical protein